jgi:hypothetical protein
MLQTKTILSNNQINTSSNECIDFELDYLGNIECVFSTKRDSRMILQKGKSIYDVIHPVNHSKFEFILSALGKGKKTSAFEMKIKNVESTASFPVIAEVTRSGNTFKVQMYCLDLEEKNRYDSSLFLNLDQEGLLDDWSEEQAFVISSEEGDNVEGVADISQLLLPVLLKSSCKENYIVTKKFPQVMFDRKIGEEVLADLFTWFFGKLDWFKGLKEYLVEGELDGSNLIVSLKYTGHSFMMHDAIKERPEVLVAYKKLLINIEKLNGTLMSASSNGGNVKLSFPIKYKVLF